MGAGVHVEPLLPAGGPRGARQADGAGGPGQLSP